ncbi:hypothetical protein ASG31_05800 [Chryseobacterium sp. Leaf404]|uniref:HET-C-related protein n=1 Tax=unclassified Chryseobacterium TaxID=2593645 RepID=UPI0006FC92FD|nr:MULTISPECIES: HET-C-related protein [unclassified Chryseobacterium]KQT18242.1 hypothetical protein ASG31_05800 [Chryseobacterium sp. Leaf404]
MSKIVALQTDPTTEGNIIVVPSNEATLNGLPIATQGSQLLYKGSPTDQPLEFVPGVLINNKPLTFVGAKTSAGASILTANQTTATIGAADGSNGTEEEPKEVSKSVELFSNYPMMQVYLLAKETAKSTFYLLISSFFHGEIPIIAYENLYNAIMDDKDSLMPPIKVMSKGLAGGNKAKYIKKEKCIEVREDTVIKTVEGNDKEKLEARAELLKALLEEYGHFLDDVLRNKFSTAGKDTQRDEGAIFSYYFTNYKLEDEEIDYAIAKIDGKEKTNLIIDLKSIKQELYETINRADKDFQDEFGEFFVAGKGDMNMKHYGHFDFESRMFTELNLDKYWLNWMYLGNYMRDMSQVIVPTITDFPEDEDAKLLKLDPDIKENSYSWADAIKPSRTTWTKIIEILAASHTMTEIRGDQSEGLPDKAKKLFETKDQVSSKGRKMIDFAKDKAESIGMKAFQLSLDYVSFIKHFEGFNASELGVYRPEEHIDNPIYAVTTDGLNNEAFYCPPSELIAADIEKDPRIDEAIGMSKHIHHTESEVKIHNAKGFGSKYEGGKLPTATECMKQRFISGVNKYKSTTNPHGRGMGIRDIGAGLHILEDYFAHTNFCEILLIKHGVSVHPWVDFSSEELSKHKGLGRFKLDHKKYKGVKKEARPQSQTKDPLIQNMYSDIIHLAQDLKKKGDLNLLPSFWVDGFYFTFKPRNGNKKLYLTSHNSTQPIILNGNKAADPLNLDCSEARKKGVYSYAGLQVDVIDQYSTLSFNNNTENNTDDVPYVANIPVVSGYFSGEDTVHSLIHAAEGLFKQTEVNLKTVAMYEDAKYSKLLKLADMLAFYVLTDLMLTQKEKEKIDKETGVDYSEIMKGYSKMIEVRGIVVGVIERAKGGGGWMLTAVVWLIESMVNALYASIMNLVKGVVIEMLEVVNNIIVQKQNLQIGRQLGIDPSHSQLAKDEFEHPLHSLASELASQAVIGVGKYLKTMIEVQRNEISGQDLYNEALKYMQHPAYCDWADAVAINWIQENPHRIEERHAKDAAFQIATETGIWVKAQVKDIRALYNSVLVTISDLRNKFEELQQTVADFLEEIERYFQMTKRQLKKEVDEIGERIDQQMKDYRKYLNDLMEEGKKWRDKLMKDGFSSLSPEEKYNFNIWANNTDNKTSEILAELKKEYPTELEKQEVGLLENQVLSYNELVIKAKEDFLNNDSNFAGKLYQYCLNDTKDEQYKKFGNLMANYRNVLQQEIDTETTYLAQSAKEHLSQARNA